MTEQLRINDIMPGTIPPPTMWKCMKTCAHVGKEMSRFPGTNTPRCDYGYNRDHLHGGMYEKIVDNRVYFYCNYYEEVSGDE